MTNETDVCRDGLRKSLHSTKEFLEEMKRLFMAGSNVSQPEVFVEAAKLNDEGLPVIELIRKAFLDDLPPTDILTFAVPLLRHCRSVTPTSLVSLLEAVNTKAPEYAGYLTTELRAVFGRDIQLGYQCLESFLGQSAKGALPSTVLAVAIAAVERAKCLEYFVCLFRTDVENALAASLFAISSLTADELSASIEIEALRELSEAAIVKEDLATQGFNLLCLLARHDDASFRRLKSSISEGIVQCQMVALRWIRFASDSDLTADFVELLMELVRISMREPELLPEVDATIATYIHRGKKAEVGSMLDIVGVQISGRFEKSCPNAFSAITNHDPIFSFVASRWLLHSGAVSHDALAATITTGIALGRTLSLDAELFGEATSDVRRRAVRRLIGICHNGLAIARALFELALDAQNREWAEHAFVDVVGNHLSGEFPGEIKTYLQSAHLRIPRGKFKSAVKQLMKGMLEWEKVLQSLPVLSELRPSRDKLASLRLVRNRRDKDIARSLEEKSVFANLASRSYIKQGRRFAVRMFDGKTTVTEMKTVSVQFELPSSEVLNPLEAIIARSIYLSDEQK